MPAPFDALSQEALVLPPAQRVELAYRLLSSIEPAANPDVEAAWDTEITERIRRFDAGTTQPIPAAEVFARLRETAPDEQA